MKRTKNEWRILAIAATFGVGCFALDCFRLFKGAHGSTIKKDFNQFYLMGLAWRNGSHVYETIPHLAAQFDERLSYFIHPSAYPPFALVISAPLSMLSYGRALFLWDLCELGFMLIAAVLLLQEFGGKQARTAIWITGIAFFVWRPVFFDLYQGQIMGLLLLLLTGCWLSLRRDLAPLSGLLFGLVLCLKFYAWPLGLLFLIYRKWRTLGVSLATVVLIHIGLWAFVGSEVLVKYYTKVAPAIRIIYRDEILNVSAWAIGFRLLGPIGEFLIPLLLLCGSLILAWRVGFDRGFLILLSTSVLLAPVTWAQYLITILPALFFLASQTRFTRTQIAVISIVLFVSTLLSEAAWALNEALFSALPVWLIVTTTVWVIVRSTASEFEHSISSYGLVIVNSDHVPPSSPALVPPYKP